ncbi:gamma-glutamyltransferase [Acuticoccus sediminis]|uniref:Glutathione hydrolase proenzyme n=1 Tax=Acuticoccus sediminis TaxID=2184697 RepID=A0A8B2NLF3_9HYPH|nr:gamma-glutamyltransferase [Acuticoccus sediminis]RAH97285.1 gamma-glutamyltransferase [Acuticoccus sediminis]
MTRRDFNAGRSAVYSQNGAAATAHPLATLTAIDVLRSGGNAVDAAIAAMAQLCVIEPHSTGLGGDCFAIYWKAGSPRPIGLNASGRAPKAATLDWYREAGIAEIQVETPHAVTVPGAVDGWCRLVEDHGTKSIEELLQPAIKSAEDGFLLAPRVAHDWARLAGKLALDPYTKARFLPGGKAPRAGDRHVQPELAETLRRVGREGRKGFYEGPVAEDIVGRLKTLGGLHTLEDFATNTPTYVDPISVNYRGYDVYEIPPAGQGIVALIMLNILSGYAYGDPGYSEADRIHLLAEAAKAAYARRNALIGDPAFVDVPTDHLLSAAEADRIRADIDLKRAREPAPVEPMMHSDTTYLTVVDKDRNAISFINSLFSGFGSGIMGPQSGVMLQNRGTSFRLIDGHPNVIEPGKRPMHTIIPAMLGEGDRMVMPFGVMGGHYQPVGHSTVVTGMLDLALDPQDALAAPRSFAFDGELRLEATISDEVAADLAARGHKVVRQDPVGGGQAIWFDHDRDVLIAGSEPRKDGCALAY